MQLKQGLNQISVSGMEAGQQTAFDELEIQFSDRAYGKAVNIRMMSMPAANGQVLIEAVIVDKNGLRVHSASERIYLSHTNPGSGGFLVKDHGTPDKSAVIEVANGRASILFEPDGGGSGAIIEARTQTLKGSYIRLP